MRFAASGSVLLAKCKEVRLVICLDRLTRLSTKDFQLEGKPSQRCLGSDKLSPPVDRSISPSAP